MPFFVKLLISEAILGVIALCACALFFYSAIAIQIVGFTMLGCLYLTAMVGLIEEKNKRINKITEEILNPFDD